MTNAKINHPKRKTLMIFICIGIFLLCAGLTFGAIYLINNEKVDETEKAKQIIRDDYELVDNDQFNDIVSDSESVFVYIGRDTCPHCAKFAPLLREAIKETNHLVYYYDTAAAREDNVDKLTENMEKFEITNVPALIKIENGAKIDALKEYESIEAIKNFLLK